MADPKRGADGVLKAASLRTEMCEHGSLTLLLLDDYGEVFAMARFDQHGAVGLMDDLGDKLETFLKRAGLWIEGDDEQPPPDGRVH